MDPRCAMPWRPALLLCFVLLPGGVTAAEPAVQLAPLSAIAVYPERQAPATVVSLNDTTIASEIAARINAIPVRVGDQVAAGEVLVRLDCRDYVLARSQAAARLDSLGERIALAEKRLQRAERKPNTGK